MTTSTSLELETHHGSGAYPMRGITLVRGKGARVWDDVGTRYIDCVGGQGAAVLGHAHPALTAALSEQAARMIACPGIFANDVRARCLQRLADVTGFPRFFLCNSGAEAIEGALKVARLVTGRPGIVAAMRGFHGRTMGALSTTWTPKYREPFEPLVPEVVHVPFDDVDAAADAVTEDTAAVLVESVQGEGGVRPPSPDYLVGLRRLCHARGALLVFDEVQTGFGRTGRWFAYNRYGVTPDLMALAKGIAGGVAMGAVALGPRVGELPTGSHGSTFGGNPLACAACVATIDTLEREQLPARADRLGTWALETLQDELADARIVREVRGLGLMIGVELRTRVTPLLKTLMADHAILALPAGSTVLRLLPPLVIDEDDWQFVVETIVRELTGTEGTSRN